ncbi:hypothetical protein SAMD00019534_048500 [Acytostelium subglobosum LB1]|uniref:hypothetical protein n=1 Tax=Acytostelium subglobosum LB1 TaxID=1410327 RepID=UPI0006448E04|nr:hypothetical protein SAMD00019534_048500 [Acytostelium subglobosum LB1]GAM21675.1 hypothetical protein SAMD00019534_048500 [Acytostelium subglobosum LB1]|eukprot:XP_012755794.1 hypothetical protein SAMD00019534_048500 [Acytostelium subglobosum LB1]
MSSSSYNDQSQMLTGLLQQHDDHSHDHDHDHDNDDHSHNHSHDHDHDHDSHDISSLDISHIEEENQTIHTSFEAHLNGIAGQDYESDPDLTAPISIFSCNRTRLLFALKESLHLLLIIGDDTSHVTLLHRCFSRLTGSKVDASMPSNSILPFGLRAPSYLFTTSMRYFDFKTTIFFYLMYQMISFFIMMWLGSGVHYINGLMGAPIWIRGVESGFASAGVAIFAMSVYDLSKNHISTSNRLDKVIFLYVLSLVFKQHWIYVLMSSVVLSALALGSERIISRIPAFSSSYPTLDNNNNNVGNNNYNKDRMDSSQIIFMKNGYRVTKRQSYIVFGVYVLLLVGLLALAFAFPRDAEIQTTTSFFVIGSAMVGGAGYFSLPLMLDAMIGLLRVQDFLKGYTLVQVLPGSFINLSSYLGSAYSNMAFGMLLWTSLVLPSVMLNFAVYPYWSKIKSSPFLSSLLDCHMRATLGLCVASIAVLWQKSVFTVEFSIITVFVIGCMSLFDVKSPIMIALSGGLGFVVQNFVLKR